MIKRCLPQSLWLRPQKGHASSPNMAPRQTSRSSNFRVCLCPEKHVSSCVIIIVFLFSMTCVSMLFVHGIPQAQNFEARKFLRILWIAFKTGTSSTIVKVAVQIVNLRRNYLFKECAKV